MAPDTVGSEAVRFVRQNSLRVADDLPNNQVAQSAAQYETEQEEEESRKERQRLEWQRFLQFETFDGNDDIARLEKECKELAETWKDFQTRFPDLRTSDLISAELPSVRTVRTTVDGVVKEWDAKKEKGFGKVKDYLIRYCDTLVAHSQLFSIIPQGDKYTSLFTGVLSSTIKAAARHKEVAEGFSQALIEISENMKYTYRQSLVYPTDRMRMLVMLLYVRYSKFLCQTMEWFSSKSKRFKSAFDQEYYNKKIKEKTKEVRDIVDQIEREAALESQGTIEDIHDHVKCLTTSSDMETYARTFMDHVSRIFRVADQNRELSDRQLSAQLQAMSSKLGEIAQGAAVAAVERLLHEQEELQGRLGPSMLLENGSIGSELGAVSPLRGVSPDPATMYDREDLERASRHLEQFYKNDLEPMRRGTDILNRSLVPGQVVIRLQDWLSATESRLLWIMGRALSPTPSDESATAAHVFHLAEDAGIPCIYFSFKISDISSHDTWDQKQQGMMVSLVYSLMRQLVLLVPPHFRSGHDFSTLLEKMDGSPETVTSALGMMPKLLSLAPRLLICVLDGLHHLSHPSINGQAEELLLMLQRPANNHTIKVLITTSGFFAGGSRLDASSRLDCSRLASRRPGRGVPGGRSLRILRFAPDSTQ